MQFVQAYWNARVEVTSLRTEKVTGTNRVTRRRFCNSVMLASTAFALQAKRFTTVAAQSGGTTLEYPPMKIGGAEALIPGSFLYFNYPTHRDDAVLVRAEDGEYFAYSRKCAHLGCTVDFDAALRRLVCSCHHGAYDARTGFRVFGPPPRPLDAIVLQMRAGGEVWAVGKTINQTERNS